MENAGWPAGSRPGHLLAELCWGTDRQTADSPTSRAAFSPCWRTQPSKEPGRTIRPKTRKDLIPTCWHRYSPRERTAKSQPSASAWPRRFPPPAFRSYPTGNPPLGVSDTGGDNATLRGPPASERHEGRGPPPAERRGGSSPRRPRPGAARSRLLCSRRLGHRGVLLPSAVTAPHCRAARPPARTRLAGGDGTTGITAEGEASLREESSSFPGG